MFPSISLVFYCTWHLCLTHHDSSGRGRPPMPARSPRSPRRACGDWPQGLCPGGTESRTAACALKIVRWLDYSSADIGRPFRRARRFYRSEPGLAAAEEIAAAGRRSADRRKRRCRRRLAEAPPADRRRRQGARRRRSCSTAARPRPAPRRFERRGSRAISTPPTSAPSWCAIAGMLRHEDHEKRLDRLIWDGQTDAARHMLPLVLGRLPARGGGASGARRRCRQRRSAARQGAGAIALRSRRRVRRGALAPQEEPVRRRGAAAAGACREPDAASGLVGRAAARRAPAARDRQCRDRLQAGAAAWAERRQRLFRGRIPVRLYRAALPQGPGARARPLHADHGARGDAPMARRGRPIGAGAPPRRPAMPHPRSEVVRRRRRAYGDLLRPARGAPARQGRATPPGTGTAAKRGRADALRRTKSWSAPPSCCSPPATASTPAISCCRWPMPPRRRSISRCSPRSPKRRDGSIWRSRWRSARSTPACR